MAVRELNPQRPSNARRGDACSPYQFFAAEVIATERLSESLVRLTFGGSELAGMTSAGLDQRIKLLLPQPGQAEPVLPAADAEYSALRELPADVRPIVRTYTVRRFFSEINQFDVDVVLHDDSGPATRFANYAAVGDRVGVFGPALSADPRLGIAYQPPVDVDYRLIAGDETALPAIGSIIESLADGEHAKVLIEVPHASDRQPWLARRNVDITWIVRGEEHTEGNSGRLVRAIQETDLPGGVGYAWTAGESGVVKAIRRHLVQDRGFGRELVSFMGYWRAGKCEDTPVETCD